MLQSFAMMTFSLLVRGGIMDDPRWDPKPSDKKKND